MIRHRSTPPTFPFAVFAGLIVLGAWLATIVVLG